MPVRGVAWLPFCLLAGCAGHAAGEADLAPTPAASAAEAPPVREQLSGRAFPEGVLALTWDDGPDVHTLALAEYLHREHVSGTFFVIHDWDSKRTSDPGFGAGVHDTGYEKLPLLAKLVALGHRVGNHTMHHALLGRASADCVGHELGDAQRAIDPFVRDELRLFRAPGGDWSASASRAVDSDPYLASLVGPVRWDIDGKDWEGSVWCGEGAVPARDCEHDGAGLRVRVDAMAERYEADVARAGRGIVLMHDRVGDVGSSYALDLAHRFIPWLEAHGYVFAAPVLAFGAPTSRWTPRACSALRLGDVDGDRRADACVLEGERVVCARASSREQGGLARATFDGSARSSVALPRSAEGFELADVSGDGRADVCAIAPDGVSCALAGGHGLGALEPWSDRADAEVFGAADAAVRFADVDGDGKADACARSPAGIVCARSTGAGFERARLWLSAPAIADWALGDVDGDGRADVCAREAGGISCALSERASFGPLARWSSEALGDGDLALGDLNGDGRADVCARAAGGVLCALSSGRALTAATSWLDERPPLRAEWGRPVLGDVNGDGRSDFCRCDGDAVRCGLAP